MSGDRKIKCTSCGTAKKMREERLKNESIQRGKGRERSLGNQTNLYADPRSGGDQPDNESKKGCAIAGAVLICIPLLGMFIIVVVVATVARSIGEISDWLLR